jgi:hypothetical protein
LAVRDWYRFFPTARLVDMMRHPPLERLREALRQRGLVVEELVVNESRAVSASAFVDLLCRRAFSTLHLIDAGAFDAGCLSLTRELANVTDYIYDYEMTLIFASAR